MFTWMEKAAQKRYDNYMIKFMNRTIRLSLCAALLCSCSSSSSAQAVQSTQPTAESTEEPAALSMSNYMDSIDTEQIGTLNTDWNHSLRVMAHALGGIDGHDYTNSLDAFVYNYNQGTRLFEIDLEYTAEGDLVLTHTWKDFRAMLEGYDGTDNYDRLSMAEFRSSKIYGRYTPVSFSDLLQIMEDIPDFHVIIDSKTFDTDGTLSIYQDIVDAVQAVDPELIHRFVPQAYTPDIYDTIASFGFDKIIFTLYSIYADSDGQKLYSFIAERNVPVVVMHMDNDWAVKVITDIYSYASMAGKQDDFTIYIHTVNDMDKALEIINSYHFFGIYSDFITENQLDQKLQA